MTHPPDRLDIDVRFLLANERTLLAWLRTALTLLAGGVGLAQLSGGHRLLTSVAVGLLALGILAAVAGYRRYVVAGRAIRAGELPKPGQGPAIITAAVITLAAILTVTYTAIGQ